MSLSRISSSQNTAPDFSSLLRHRMRRIFLMVLLALLVVGLSLVFTLRTGHHLAEVYTRHVEATNRIQIELTLGHLWFEEIMAGDDERGITEVWHHFEAADRLATAILAGGETDFGKVYPLNDPGLRGQVDELLVQLDLFRAAAKHRFDVGQSARAGTLVDQQFDGFFESFLQGIEALNRDLHLLISRELRKFRIIQGALLAFSLALAVVMLAILYRYEMSRTEATRVLAASELRYRSFFEAAVEGIIIADQTTGSISYANPAICRKLGYDLEELLQLKIFELHSERHLEGIQERLQSHGNGNQGALMEIIFTCKDGSEFPAEVNSGPVEIDGRLHSIGLIKDLTERHEAKTEKEKLESQLRQAQKMEAVGNLAGGIAHDFNNLLQAILGYSEIMLEDGNLNPDCSRDLKKIQYSAERAADLTRQLLTFSRRQLISPQDFNLNQVIAEILKMLERLIGEGIELQSIVGHNLGTVCVDRSQFEQVLMNLCLNARDAMKGKGTLTIETENVVLDSKYCEDHPWAQPGRFVLLSVTDNGMGMDQNIIDQIFDPFFTTKEVGKGTGLGLSTVYGIVKQNSGLIHVYSELNCGTTFKIYIPMVERPAQDVGNKIFAPTRGGDETLLLAEDDPGVRGLATRILEDAGYHVLIAEDGELAWEIFQANAEILDLALLDVVMPKMGGREVQEEIFRIRPGFKVVFASGYSENAIHVGFVLDEKNILIQKPYRRDDLLSKIREVLDS